jgi:3-phosphoshikimate 1-carboxyvinyltransferase
MTVEHPIQPAIRIEGDWTVPGDKSISHRALIVAAMGEGIATIAGLSSSADVVATLDAVRRLGVKTLDSQVKVERHSSLSNDRDLQILLEGQGTQRWAPPSEPIDVRNSGTTIRTLLGPLSASSIEATLTGDASIKRRPMRRVVEPLRRMGAQIEGEEGGDRAPLKVRGTQLRGMAHRLEIPSAQVKTALLLAGLLAEGETTVLEEVQSRDHTERLLKYLGVPVAESIDGLSVKSTNLRNAELSIPGDLSSAAFFLVGAAILPGSDLTVRNVGVNPTRLGILEILRDFGANVEVSDETEACGEPRATIRVRPGDRRPVTVAGPVVVRAIDELPLIAVLGSVAEGETVLSDASELRVKESDRIASIVDGLAAMGADIRPTPDGFSVRGPVELRGANVDAAGDHRIAMAFAIAGLMSEGTTSIRGWDSVAVSYPEFERDLEHLVVR